MRVMLKYLSGERAPAVEVFSLGARSELMLGPAGEAAVRYHPLLDERVGRWHARIVPVEGTPGRFVIVDLDAGEMLRVNGRRVSDAVVLRPSDVIQLGTEGPRIEFQVDRTG